MSSWIFLLRRARVLWQVLPLGPPANGNSPYSSTSAFAGNPLLISLERLAERGWIEPSRLADCSPAKLDAIDYEDVYQRKLPLIVEAARTFLQSASGQRRASALSASAAQNSWWLEDFVLFDVAARTLCPAMLEGMAARTGPPRDGSSGNRAPGTGVRDKPASRDPVFLLRAVACPAALLRATLHPGGGRYRDFRGPRQRRRLVAPRSLPPQERQSRAGSCLRRASRRLQRHRPALGQSSLRLGT